MAQHALSRKLAEEAVALVEKAGGSQALAAELGRVNRSTLQSRVRIAKELYGLVPKVAAATGINVEHETARLIGELKGTIAALQRDNERLEHEQVSAERLKRLIHGCDRPATPPKWLFERTSGRNTGAPTLFCSDWHWWEVVNPAEINYVNAFNKAIGYKRAKRLFETAINLLVHHMAKPKYDYICVPLGGDMISGNIHEELRESNEGAMTACIVDLCDVLIAGFDALLKEFKKLYVPCVVGNHGRLDKKPRFKGRAVESFEWLLYQFLKRHYAGDDRVHFEIADGPDLQYTIYKTRYLLTHGDQFRGGSGIAGALSPLLLGDARKRKRALAINQPFDYIVMGHWHQYIHAKGIIVNASLKGYDEYAFQNNFDFEPAAQAMWLTHPDWGITARWPIILEKPGERFTP